MGWLFGRTRCAPTRTEPPKPTAPERPPKPDRATALATILDPKRLPTPPTVALGVASAAGRPNCKPEEIVALLSQDPALSAQLLRAVNSCLYARAKPIASLDRAVTALGLGPVRALALSLSLPAVTGGPTDTATRNYQVTSVAGAIIARDLSARVNRSGCDDDLSAALMRDIGVPLIRRAYPDAWDAMADEWGDRLLTEPCEAEEATFGLTHPEVGAELLARWQLPDELVVPIRYHHDPKRAADQPKEILRRAELLYFAGLLANLDAVVRHPHVFDYVLKVAQARYDLPKPKLILFLRGVVEKVVDFGALLKQDVRDCPNFGDILEKGDSELKSLTVAAGPPGDGPPRVGPPAPAGPTTPPPVAAVRLGAVFPGAAPARPHFLPAFLDEFPAGGCLLGEYELHAVLGRGGMGVVFKGFEPNLGRDVAVKMLALDSGNRSSVRERFAREARACASIRHENVITVYAVGEAGGFPYLVMEFVEGVSLDRHIEESGPLPVPTAVRLARLAALGLEAAHRKGIVHRDVKPGNILLERDTGAVKVADFGLSRNDSESRVSQTGLVIGTPNYMSPEQVTGGAVGPVSDLFGLGGVLYAMLAGRAPFSSASTAATLHAVVHGEPTPIRQHRPDVPAQLEEVIGRLLSKNPGERYRSAAEAEVALVTAVPEAR